MRERDYQAGLIERIKERFPDCMVLKNDSAYIQGIPDLTVLNHDRWGVLEVKKSEEEPYRPNQEHYLGKLDKLGFAATIYPENENEVLDALQQSFGNRRKTRVPKPK